MDKIQTRQVKGIQEQDLQAWRHHPVSLVVLQYLRDWAEALKKEAWERLQGPLDEKLIGELIGRVNTSIELADLPFEAIYAFYQKPEEENATQTVQN